MPELNIHGKKVIVPVGFGDMHLPNKEYFSHSQFSMYRRCPRQFEYRYILGIRQPPGIAMTQGSVIHEGAEKTHRHTIEHGTPLSLAAAESVVSDTFDRMKGNIEDWGDTKPDRVKEMTLHHFRVYHAQSVPLVRPKAVEEPFAVKVGTVPMVGFIDLIDEVMLDRETDVLSKGEGPLVTEVVADLKFTGRKWQESKLRHDTQLTLYAHVKGIPRVRIDFLLDQKSGTRYVQERSLRTPQDAKNFTEDLEECVDLIKKGVFPRCDPTTWACTPRFCGYYERCRGPQ